jgi:acyl carrier protein
VDHTATITQYIVDEFLPDVQVSELAPDYDLLAGGVIDSLGLLRVVDWIAQRFDLSLDEIDLMPENFRTVNDIKAFIIAAMSVTGTGHGYVAGRDA